ncbi:FUSC family protein [Cellulomonas sp. JZ18]|uniref:FUSC family protein n=1 Tax=Cellulomonas sp. JZ18 TaxID=2654191 RepID=UPI0012D43754|nr:FUSC family protein [Cellulomonas sp. JZ18]QGQ20190.1 FUSC family protein [Cellulomonas sp. JZ18]
MRVADVVQRVAGADRPWRSLDVETALRVAVANAVPLALVVATGETRHAAFAMFAAFTAIYGRAEPYRRRVVTVTAVALLMTAAMAAGTALGLLDAPVWAAAVGLVVVLVAGVCVIGWLQGVPPQPIFPVFAYLTLLQVPLAPHELPRVAAITLGSVAWAWGVSLVGYVVRAVLGARLPGLFAPLGRGAGRTAAVLRDPALWRSAALVVLGALTAGAVGTALRLPHVAWAVVAVVATLPAYGRPPDAWRSVRRLVGTVAGALVAGALLAAEPPVAVVVAVVVVCAAGAEVVMARSYALGLAFVTPVALLAVHLSAPGDPTALAVDRVVETALGAAVSLALLGAARLAAGRRAGAAPA